MIYIVVMYLMLGCLNVYQALLAGTLMIRRRRDRAAWVEVGFFLLLWPMQFLFWMIVSIHNASGWVLERIFR